MKLLNNRWKDKSSYKDRWVLRNKEMAIILNKYLPKIKSIAVMGSGPKQHFESEIKKLNKNIIIKSYDLKKWNDNIKKINLEKFEYSKLKNIECVVFSGVLEYINLSETLKETFKNVDYVLMSYAPIDFTNFTLKTSFLNIINLFITKYFTKGKSVKDLKSRIKAGWRSFYTNFEFIKELSNYGLIIYFDKSKSYPSQGIYFVKSKIKNKGYKD
nr:hypothetical protein [Prochlorococcus marinus]